MMAGNTSHAVRAQRAKVAPNALDYYPTPPWAARAGAELILGLDPEASSCWEPAAGGGHMAGPLGEYFPGRVVATDVFDYGIGAGLVDFLDAGALAEAWGDERPDWIVTNPPFKIGETFLRLGLRRARRGVALLLRLSFLESARRYELIFQRHPLSVLAPFVERVPMVAGRWDPQASTATAYAWFIWKIDRLATGEPAIVLPIAPGARARFQRPGDVERYAPAKAAGPLFAGAGE